jgi:hypothetical protein
MIPQLTSEQAAIAAGAQGEGRAMAMRIVAQTARLMQAPRLIPIRSAHIDGALYHGDSGTLFAERLVAGGARVSVRATLNVGALDLTGCSKNRLPPHEREMARRMRPSEQQITAMRDLQRQHHELARKYRAEHHDEIEKAAREMREEVQREMQGARDELRRTVDQRRKIEREQRELMKRDEMNRVPNRDKQDKQKPQKMVLRMDLSGKLELVPDVPGC